VFHIKKKPVPVPAAPAVPAPPPVPLETVVTALANGVNCDALWSEALHSGRPQVSELLTQSFQLRCPVGSFTAWVRALAGLERSGVSDGGARAGMAKNLGAFLASQRRLVAEPTELNRLVAILTLLVASRALQDKELPPEEWQRWGVAPKADRAAALAELLAALFERAVQGEHAADLRSAYWATAAVLLFAEGALARVKKSGAADLPQFAEEAHRALAGQPPVTKRTDGPFALFNPPPAPTPQPRRLSTVERARLLFGGNLARLTVTGYATVAGLAVSVALVAVGGWWFHSGRVTTSAFDRDTNGALIQELNPTSLQR
jgi:hypothetical protein